MITDNKSKKPIKGILIIGGVEDGLTFGVSFKPNIFRRILMSIVGIEWMTIEKYKNL